jgi:hypothetical protein
MSPDDKQHKPLLIQEESKNEVQVSDDEPLKRTQLPWLKDPANKINVWKLVKDNLGKEFYRMTMPVEMNSPLNTLQASSQCTEYADMLDRACEEEDSLLRLSLLCAYITGGYSPCERCIAKPFNPLLGETFEIVTDKFVYLNEQVSHHPPAHASYCRGKNWMTTSNNRMANKFNGRFLEVKDAYRGHVEFYVKVEGSEERVTERYEI